MRSLCLILVGIAIVGFGTGLYTGIRLHTLERRIEKIEGAQLRATPEMAWLIEALETIFNMGLNNHADVQAYVHQNYLSHQGAKSYNALLSDLQLVQKLQNSDRAVAVQITTTPRKAWATEPRGTPEKDGPYSLGGSTTYWIDLSLSFYSSSQIKEYENLTIAVTVGNVYNKNPPYIITSLRALPPKESNLKLP
ncbi:MAG: hypothetical protein KKA05_06840 [Alphaproteobacteria bacterium]|nr:hypothetical protein [Alphaproteobacteria bacterium]MBU0859172.1 hypothetical protein [Alphaproteobacteria bacterium]